MESQTSRWSAPSLTRHRTAVIAVAAVALGCSLYYYSDQIWSSHQRQEPSTSGLRRSNAHRHQRPSGQIGSEPRNLAEAVFDFATSRYTLDQPWGSTPVNLDFLRTTARSNEILSHHLVRPREGQIRGVVLDRYLPSVDVLRGIAIDSQEAALFRRELEEAYLNLCFFRYLPPNDISPEQQEEIIRELGTDGGFHREAVLQAILRHQSRQLRHVIELWLREQSSRGEEVRNAVHMPRLFGSTRDPLVEDSSAFAEDEGSVTVEESDHSWRGGWEMEVEKEASEEGQSLLHLLYDIAKEKVKKDGHMHRRVTCNSCNTMPIRGIRYHCANCRDYDLCEECEATQIHPKTHVFYKIRVPAPFIRNPEPEPVWYPGRPHATNHALPKDITANICGRTGFQDAEVEALWEQFRCLAATEWPEDPFNYRLAIDRQTFDKCFIPQTSSRPPTPNLIFDRLFASYDQNNDGLIGFNEFIEGVASLTRNKVDEYRKRVFKAYDINNDGYVDRKDCLRMFKAYYALLKELTRGIVAEMEEDVSDAEIRDFILSSQPISSAFTCPITPGERSRNELGKTRDNHGDSIIIDDKGVIDEHNHDLANPYDTMGERMDADQIQALTLEQIRQIYIAPWPLEVITMEDIEKIFNKPVPPMEIKAASDQSQIRRVAHARLARDYQVRSRTRRLAIRDREERKEFYIGDDYSTPARGSALKSYDKDGITELEHMQSSSFGRLKTAGRQNELFSLLEEKINGLGWPVYGSPRTLAEDIIEMISQNWTGLAIAEDIRGYAPCANLTETAEFIRSIFELLEQMAGMSLSGTSEQEATRPQSLPRRSRSSSKVRFQDDIEMDDDRQARSRAKSTSSHSMSINEPLGGIEVPEPEHDIGRDALYQFTQEALNELLDPIFRLKEDLAMRILQTKKMRESSRAETAASVKDPVALERDIILYEKRWRSLASRHAGPGEHYAYMVNESESFYDFLRMRAEGEMNEITGDKCPQCAQNGQEEWIGLGNHCGRCARPSDFRGSSPPLEQCIHCSQRGKKSATGGAPDAIACPVCGQRSIFHMVRRRMLLGIISGVGRHSKVQLPTEDEIPAAVGNPNHVARPSAPFNLDSAVADFNRSDPEDLEQSIFHRPLENLPTDSGYGVATSSREASPPPDPTLPQNRLDDSQLSVEGNASHSNSHVNGNSPHDGANLPLPFSGMTAENPTSSKHLEPGEPSAEEKPPLDKETLRFFAALNLLEYIDEKRGGPGRLSFEEFDQVMNGKKGPSLKFLGSWMQMTSF